MVVKRVITEIAAEDKLVLDVEYELDEPCLVTLFVVNAFVGIAELDVGPNVTDVILDD